MNISMIVSSLLLKKYCIAKLNIKYFNTKNDIVEGYKVREMQRYCDVLKYKEGKA